ncbi:unnamed protein product, partial [Discosporangium mesarthrocarpum]
GGVGGSIVPSLSLGVSTFEAVDEGHKENMPVGGGGGAAGVSVAVPRVTTTAPGAALSSSGGEPTAPVDAHTTISSVASGVGAAAGVVAEGMGTGVG